MSRVCEFCGRRPRIGNQVTRRGIAKKKGGIGRRVTGRSKRRFLPNLQSVRAQVGTRVVRVRICTRCLKAGKIVKPRPGQSVRPAAVATPGAAAHPR
jgi:large subunit ribosomal protein L28